jgi:single-stranded-DNA-specific exonuclease
MYEEMCKCQELLTKFGGHPMAAGLSLPVENIEAFRQKINALATLTEDELVPKVRIDVPMPLDYVTMDLVQELSILAPFGKDNGKPVFADKNLAVRRMTVMGKNKNVLKLALITNGGKQVTGIYFGDVEGFLSYLEGKYGKTEVEAAMREMSNAIRLSMVYFPKINSFRGVDEIQFEIQYYQ